MSTVAISGRSMHPCIIPEPCRKTVNRSIMSSRTDAQHFHVIFVLYATPVAQNTKITWEIPMCSRGTFELQGIKATWFLLMNKGWNDLVEVDSSGNTDMLLGDI